MVLEIGFMLVAAVVFSVIGVNIIVADKIESKKKIVLSVDNVKKLSKKEKIYVLAMIIMNIALSIWLSVVYFEHNTLIESAKRLALVSILLMAAFFDYKRYIIPNKLIILGLEYRAIFLVFEIIFERDTIIQTIVSEVAAAVCLILVSAISSIIIKNSIGMGDIKMFIVMSLMQGITGIASSIFMSLVLAFFAAIVLLLFKKKTRKETIPFAPCLLVGTYIAVAVTGL